MIVEGYTHSMNYDKVIDAIIGEKAARATYYESPTKIIRATRKKYKNGFKEGNIEILLTIGRPNYQEREFIKLCKKAKEPFPIKKVQLKFLVPKKVMKKAENLLKRGK